MPSPGSKKVLNVVTTDLIKKDFVVGGKRLFGSFFHVSGMFFFFFITVIVWLGQLAHFLTNPTGP